MIVKRGARYDVLSESGKRLGKGLSKKGAENRLRQIEWFRDRDAKRRINRKA